MRMISLLDFPSAVRRATYSLVGMWHDIRVITMRQSAWLACRSPPRLRRWSVTLPEEASSGATPQSLAQVASLRSREGLSPAAMGRRAAVSGPRPTSSTSSGATLLTKRAMRTSRCSPSSPSATARRPSVARAVFVAIRTGSASACTRRIANPAARRHGGTPTNAFPQLIGGGVDELTDLVHGLGSRFARAAPGHHEGADGFDAAVAGLGHAKGASGQRGPDRLDGIE